MKENTTAMNGKTTTKARGERNNNPLNIKYLKTNNWLGKVPDREKKDTVFEEFTSMVYGLRAAIKLIRRHIARENAPTPRAIINRWAPPTADHNPTEAYITFVEQRMKQLMEKEWALTNHYDPASRINPRDFDQMRALVTAMCEFESKYTPMYSQFNAAWKTV